MRAAMKKDWVIMLISLLTSIALWVYVSYVVSPEYVTVIEDIQVVPVNESSDFANGKLAIVDQTVETIEVEIRGDRKTIAALNDEKLKANIDLGGITEAGYYDNLPISIDLSAYGVSVVSKTPQKCSITVDRVVMVPKRITVITTGEFKDGYAQKGDAVVTPEEVIVTGFQRNVDRVASAQAVVDVSEAGKDIRKNVPIQLCDASGNVLTIGTDSSDLPGVKIDKTEASVYIQVMKNIPVKLDTHNSNDDERKTIEYEIIENSYISVWGDSEIIDSIKEIMTVKIDLADVSNGEEKLISVILPEGVETDFDASTQKVKIRFKVTQQ